MRKRDLLAAVSFAMLFSTYVNAEQVKYPLPESRPFCDDGQMAKIQYSGSRETAFVTSHPIFPKYYVYDVEMKCTMVVFSKCPPNWTEYKEILKNAQKGDLLKSTIKSDYGGNACINGVAPVISDLSSDYQQWQTAKIRVDKEKDDAAEIERNLNQIVTMPLPKYADSDSVISVDFDGNNLIIGNKTTDFVNITSVSTYLNSQINTISDLKKELPPESVAKKPLSRHDLFTHDMIKSVQFRNKVKNVVSVGTTKFGFAIKYSINGVEKRYYSTKQYKNSDLLLGL